MADQVEYVYAVIDATAALGAAPRGIEDAPVRLEREGALAAVVSSVDADAYAPGTVEARTADLDWLGPRARAHDRVVTWTSEQGAVVPLPMFSLFYDPAGVRRMLRDRSTELGRALERVRGREEYAVRVFRIDDELTAHLGELSPRISELEREAADASPGERYLLGRKLDSERRAELRRVGTEIAQRVFDALAARADGAVVDRLPRRTPENAAGTAVLSASFLVRRGSTEPFRRALTEQITDLEPSGFRFEFTGPWPPYHFAGEPTDADAHDTAGATSGE
jgi:hypothetical protein